MPRDGGVASTGAARELVSVVARRPKEVFYGPRLAVRVPSWVRARSLVLLVLASVVMGIVLAAGLAAATWYVLQLVVHALSTGA